MLSGPFAAWARRGIEWAMAAFSITLSTALSAAEAVEELARGVQEGLGGEVPIGGLLLATAALGDRAVDVGRGLGERWPEATWAGTGFEGLLAGGRVFRGEPALGLLAWPGGASAPVPFLLERELFALDRLGPDGQPGEAIAGALREELVGLRLGSDDLLLLFPDAHALGDVERWLRTAVDRLGGPATAGAAATGPAGAPSVSWIQDELHPGAPVGLLVPGGAARVPLATSGASRRASPWLEIDACRGRWIDALEGEPPVDWIRRQLGLEPGARIEPQLDRLLVRLAPTPPPEAGSDRVDVDEGDYCERYVVGLDEHSGAISLPVEVRRGEHLAFALPDAACAREGLRRMLRELPPSEVLLQLACRSRDESLHGDLDVESALVAAERGDAQILGTLAPFQLGPGPGGRPSVLVHKTVLVSLGALPSGSQR